MYKNFDMMNERVKYLLIRLPLLFIVLSFMYACAPETQYRRGFAPKPCLECHKEMMSDFKKQYVHSPNDERFQEAICPFTNESP
jgi:hypothetical protein